MKAEKAHYFTAFKSRPFPGQPYPLLFLRKINAAVTGGQYTCCFSHQNRYHHLLL